MPSKEPAKEVDDLTEFYAEKIREMNAWDALKRKEGAKPEASPKK